MEYILKHYATITYTVNGILVEDRILLDPALDTVTQIRDRVETTRVGVDATVFNVAERYEYEPVAVDQTLPDVIELEDPVIEEVEIVEAIIPEVFIYPTPREPSEDGESV